MKRFVWFAPLIMFCGAAVAETPESVRFSHKDWEIACDNTRTCRAAGYGVKDGEVSVLFTRQGGAFTDTIVEVAFGAFYDESETPDNLDDPTLIIDYKPQGKLTKGESDYWNVTPEQSAKLVSALIRSSNVMFQYGGKLRELSSAGFNAVMLKMDDVQGRLNTASAIIKKGAKGENDVPPAVKPPVIVAAPTNQALDKNLIPKNRLDALVPQLKASAGEDCILYDDVEGGGWRQEDIALINVDHHHSLIEKLCWRAAYNEGYAYWLIDNALKGEPTLITTSASSYDNGTIWLWQKGRGIGDCGYHVEWVWDGVSFKKSEEYSTGDCRAITPGGTWRLYNWVAEVAKP